MKVAIIGDRGIPARYSGFSTLVEQLALRLTHDHGMDVSVYCRNHYYDEHPREWEGVRCVWLPAPGGKSFESIVHSNLAILHASVRDYDVVFVVDPGNGPFALPLKLMGIPTIYHTDGLGWMRRKWSPTQRRYYRWSEKVTARLADWLVTDCRAMQEYYRTEYGADSTFIPYSGDVGEEASIEALERFGVKAGEFYLVVARMEPENNVDLIIREYLRSGLSKPLIVVGSSPYATEYWQSVQDMATGPVRCVGSIFEPHILNGLYANCAAYFHGHEVGGTNPSLLRAMHWGAACCAIDVVFHREALGESGSFFRPEGGHLASILVELEGDPARRADMGRKAKARADGLYRWDAVGDAYAALFRDVHAAHSQRLPLKGRLAADYYHPCHHSGQGD